MFKLYKSKPIERRALRMKYAPIHVTGNVYMYDTDVNKPSIKFVAHQEPKVGDWIVHLNDKDIYHCTDEVFRDRNIVPEEE